MKTKTLVTVIAVTVIAVAAVFAFMARGSSSDGQPASGGGESASAAPASTAGAPTVMTPAGFDIASYAGEPLVINFFGSWCGPCQMEAADLATFSRESGAQIVGIALNDTEADALAFMDEFGLAFPVVMDDNSLAAQYGITGVPTTIFLDKRGREADRLVGASTLEQFEASFAKAQ